ncbi:MAG: hypothetical protein GY755_04855 [Chloroflexi bacterium]|nr:hypothetical protein [Chloroflexota bacterium]
MNIENQLRDGKIRGILSSLWIFFFINHFFMGLHEFANPVFIEQLIGGGFDVSDSLLLMAAITIELPILMIVLSRVLPNKINWIVNILVAVFTIGLEIMNNPNPDLDNIFFLAAELIGFVTIIVISIRWRSRLIKENRN